MLNFAFAPCGWYKQLARVNFQAISFRPPNKGEISRLVLLDSMLGYSR